MPKNLSVIDILPKNLTAIDILPENNAVIDILPKNMTINSTTEQYYSVVLGRGMPIGLLLALTYPAAGTVSSSYAP